MLTASSTQQAKDYLSTTRVIGRSDLATPIPNQLEMRAAKLVTGEPSTSPCNSAAGRGGAVKSGGGLSLSEAERLIASNESSPCMLITTELAMLDSDKLSLIDADSQSPATGGSSAKGKIGTGACRCVTRVVWLTKKGPVASMSTSQSGGSCANMCAANLLSHSVSDRIRIAYACTCAV